MSSDKDKIYVGPKALFQAFFPNRGIHIIKIRLSSYRLIFIGGIPKLLKQHLYIKKKTIELAVNNPNLARSGNLWGVCIVHWE